jgi:hypothetical protein
VQAGSLLVGSEQGSFELAGSLLAEMVERLHGQQGRWHQGRV